jgi:hypothetical protein
MIDDLKGDESWRMFRIISEFTEGFDKLADIGFPSPSLARLARISHRAARKTDKASVFLA